MPVKREARIGGVVVHILKPREQGLGKMSISFRPKDSEAGAVFGFTSPTAIYGEFTVPDAIKHDFIQALRTALEEWEKI